MPVLLRTAVRSYGRAVRAGLVAEGFDDLPGNGAFVLGGVASGLTSAAELVRWVGMPRQAASQLLDVLVVRGYLTRGQDPNDRRRLLIELTERGRAAVAVIRVGVERVDAELARRVSSEELGGLRAGLEALAEIGASSGRA